MKTNRKTIKAPFLSVCLVYPGFNQVNVRMPGGIAPGPANEVTIAVQ
jgi:hypothetical protein